MVFEHKAVLNALKKEGMEHGGMNEACFKRGSSSLIPSSSDRKWLVSKTEGALQAVILVTLIQLSGAVQAVG